MTGSHDPPERVRIGSDDEERDLRLELLRLDRQLKLLDLARLDQQLAYGPIKRLLFVVGVTCALVAGFTLTLLV